MGRALALPPTLFILDEPLSKLDPLSRVKVRDELKRIHGEIHATTLYVTHNLPEAMALGDRLGDFYATEEYRWLEIDRRYGGA